MPRKPVTPGEPPKVLPEKAVPILEDLIRKGEQLRNVNRHSPEVTQWAETAEQALAAALGSQHDTVQSFRREFHGGVYYPHDSPARLQQQFLRQLTDGLAILGSAIQQLQWQLPDPTQVFLPAGSQHDAYREIRDIVSSAATEVLIVDPYVDHTLWTLLTNISRSVRIRILTDRTTTDFSLEPKKFAAQHGNTIEIRQTKKYHDRFIVLDGKTCWHVGASIKDAGNKACAFSKFERQELLTVVISDIENVWARSASVPI